VPISQELLTDPFWGRLDIWKPAFIRPGGTRDSSPAIYRRVGHKDDLRPGGTLEQGPGLLHGEEGKTGRLPYANLP
jgi:hypothetical protein